MADDDETADLRFTQNEVDMIYFSCLDYLGHPDAEDWALSDAGFKHLLTALTKIQDYNNGRHDGPQVIEPS